MESNQKSIAAWRRWAGKIYALVLRRGWRRWVFLAAMAVLFLIAVAVVSSGVDYRRTPSALVPRDSLYFYAETRDLSAVLEILAGWEIWQTPADLGESRNWLQVELARRLGAAIDGLGPQLPRQWLDQADRAAISMLPADGELDQTWAVYLECQDPSQIVSELRIDSGITVDLLDETRRSSLYQINQDREKSLYLAVVEPWVVLSPDRRLPAFAIESVRNPSLTMARTDALPVWRRWMTVRGVYNPHHISVPALSFQPEPYLSRYIRPDARVAFTAKVESLGAFDLSASMIVLEESVDENGIWWPAVKFLFTILATCLLFLMLATLSAIIGFGGWLKILAVKAGISPRDNPEPVTPSQAFSEDSGEVAKIGKKDGEIVPLLKKDDSKVEYHSTDEDLSEDSSA